MKKPTPPSPPSTAAATAARRVDEPRRPRTVRFRDDEWQTLRDRAREAGMQRGRFIRRVLFRAVPKPHGSDQRQQLLAALGHIGRNINQLAHRANQGLPVATSELAEHLKELRAAMKRI